DRRGPAGSSPARAGVPRGRQPLLPRRPLHAPDRLVRLGGAAGYLLRLSVAGSARGTGGAPASRRREAHRRSAPAHPARRGDRADARRDRDRALRGGPVRDRAGAGRQAAGHRRVPPRAVASAGLVGIAVLADLHLHLWEAIALLALFALQFPFPQTQVRIGFAIAYAALALVLLVWRRRELPRIARYASCSSSASTGSKLS